MKKVLFHEHERYFRITLNDPPLNILDIAMLRDLRDALSQVDDERSVLVIDASGSEAFSAGASIHDHVRERVQEMLSTFHDCLRRLTRLDLVTVAMVDGLALGGGSELAFACDFVLASDSASFGYPEIKIGAFPPAGAWQLSRHLPPRIGLELMLTGRRIPAAEAAALGLVNAVWPRSRFREASVAWMEALFEQSPSSLRIARKAFRLASAGDFEKTLAAMESLYLSTLVPTADADEGIAAFIEKRKPVWQGR